jgi:hypothetical protein
MPTLNANTIVRARDGTFALLAEGGPLPDWAAGQVGEHLLEGGTAASAGDKAELEQLRKDLAEAKLAASGAGAPEPPRAGSKASREAWATYAAGRGIEVPEGASMTQIIGLVDAVKAPAGD